MEEEKIRNKQKKESEIVETKKIAKSQDDLEKDKIVNKKITATQGVAKSKACDDKNCHKHGSLKTHGRVFEGTVTKKFHKRIVIEFERMIYIRKYERYAKSRTKIHARLPDCMKDEIHIGDHIKIQECRPLSKLIHFIVIEKIRGGKK